MTDPRTPTDARWLSPGVRGIGAASFLADVGHEIPTALLPNLLTATLGAPAAALGLIEGLADGLAGVARLAGGAIADDPQRRRAQAVGGYATTAVLSSLIGAATAVWQVAVLRAGAWAARGLRVRARGLRVPARNALLADIVPANVHNLRRPSRAYRLATRSRSRRRTLASSGTSGGTGPPGTPTPTTRLPRDAPDRRRR